MAHSLTPMQSLQDQINTGLVIAAALGSAAVHAYQIVVKGGGIRGIWRRFVDGDKGGSSQ